MALKLFNSKKRAAEAAEAVETAPAPETNVAAEPEQDSAQALAPARGKLMDGIKRVLKGQQASRQLDGAFESYAHLMAIKPREGYLFRSDYFEVDANVGCVLSFFHDEAAHDTYPAFWGIDRIPDALDDQIVAVVLEQVVRKDEKWVESYKNTSEKLSTMDSKEQGESGTSSSMRKTKKKNVDLEQTTAELDNGASYLNVHVRLLLKAPDLEMLEEALDRVARLYIDRFGTLKAAPYVGEQRRELSSLLHTNDKKRGKGFSFTSTEFAGSYSLVTNGLNDRGGEYVGNMVGDLNNSAVLMDVNKYEHHVVIADATRSKQLDRQLVSDMWCSKASQAALLENGRVVHLVLDGANLDKLGPEFEDITSRVDLNKGDVNMFEMFGDSDEAISVFATQMRKLVLMFEQVFEATDSDRSIIRTELESTATKFYVEQGQWRHNAKENRDALRVVNVRHEQVPRLQTFVMYLDMEYKAMLNSDARDPEALHAYGVLRGVARNMLNNNGDLFNNITSDAVDGVRDSRRVVYDFSQLMRRGKGVAMAQLVNIVGFAVGRLGVGDSVVIHGAENIDDRVKEYIQGEFGHLFSRGGRVVYSYNDVDAMLKDSDFNSFDTADYTLFGAMPDKTVDVYQKKLAQKIPPDLANLITLRGEGLSYLRRDTTNVVFYTDLALGINSKAEQRRRELRMEAALAQREEAIEALKKGEVVAGAGNTAHRGSGEFAVEVDADGTSVQPPAKTAQRKRGSAAKKLAKR